MRTLTDPASGEPLDQALVLWMPGPQSFTGEDQAELHIHGGLATRAAVLRALGSVENCRPAEAGEFTRRAFLNGRMDLSPGRGPRRHHRCRDGGAAAPGLRQLEGRWDMPPRVGARRCCRVLALLEASLDFSDEGDVPEDLEAEILAIDRIAGEIGRAAPTAAASACARASPSCSPARPMPANRPC